MTLFKFALAALVATLFAFPAQAARLALVIGNNSYDELDSLKNTHADGRAYTDAFTGLGYDVTFLTDLDFDGMARELDRFLDRVQPGDDVAFVYSGHGWSDGQVNYLVPTDAPREGSDRQIKRASLALKNGFNGILDELHKAGGTRVVAIVDACRDNPFQPLAGTRSSAVSRGLAPVQASTGTFVIFSAGEGQRALDRLPTDPPGEQLSVFTRHFAPLLSAGLSLETAISQAQVATAEAARAYDNHVQHPAYYDQVLGDTCLSEKCESNVVIQAAPKLEKCDILYSEARTAESCFTWEAYVDQCPHHDVYFYLAEVYLERNCVSQDGAKLQPTPDARSAEDASSQSPRVAEYIRKTHALYQEQGISELAPHVLELASCDICAPYLVFCNTPVAGPSDLAGQRIRGDNGDTVEFLTSLGAKGFRLAFAEVALALKVGVISCAATGGHVP